MNDRTFASYTSPIDFHATSQDSKEIELFDYDLDPNNPFRLEPEHCRLACALDIYVKPKIYKMYGENRILNNGDSVRDALGRCILSQLGLRGELPSVFTDMPSLLRLHCRQKRRQEYLALLTGVSTFKSRWEPIAFEVWNKWCALFQLKIAPVGEYRQDRGLEIADMSSSGCVRRDQSLATD